MLFIKAVNTDTNTVEYFNLSKVLTIKPYENGTTKLLLGAGLSYKVYSDSIEKVNALDDLLNDLKEL